MRVLFLTHRLPYAPNRGDRIRAFHILKTLAPRVELDLVSLVHSREEEAQAASLRNLGINLRTFRVSPIRGFGKALLSLAGDRPLTHAFLDCDGITTALQEIAVERPPDVVLAYCSGMARFALEPPLAGFPLVLDLVDVDSEKWRLLAATTKGPMGWVYAREARTLARFERRAALRARTTLVVNERERDALQHLAPDASIRIMNVGVDLGAFKPRDLPAGNNCVVFCGVMSYQPNVQGILWFVKNVWPRIIAQRPDTRLMVVGSDPVPAVRRLADHDHRIHVTGSVADVRPYLWNGAVSIAPLGLARGIQNKVLEAIAAGLPVVVTSPVFDGLPSEAHPACFLANTPETFAEQVITLLALEGVARRAIAQTAKLEPLSWQRRLSPLVGILAEASEPHLLPRRASARG